MKKFIKLMLIALLTVVNMSVTNVKADEVSGSASIYASASSVKIGDNVTITVSISCSGGSMAKIRLNYNSSYLQFLSSSGDFNGGVFLIDASTSNGGSQSFTFKTVGVGSTNVSISVLEFESMQYSRVNYNSSASTNISVYTPSVTPVTPTPSPSPSPSPTPVVPQLSADASLAEITLANAELEPKFSSNVTQYVVYLPKDTTTLDLTAKASSAKASVGEIVKEVKSGWNEIKITCTAENSNTTTYTIKAYVEEVPTVFYDLKGSQYGVVKNLDKVALEGFEKQEVEQGEEKLTVFASESVKLLYLENTEGERNFYIYDEVNNNITDIYRPVYIDNKIYLINTVDYADFEEMEDRYIPEKVRINEEETVDGWGFKESNLTDFKLVHLTDDKGESQLYKLDTKEGSLQRYVIPEEPAPSLLPYMYLSGTVAGLVTLVFALILLGRKEEN